MGSWRAVGLLSPAKVRNAKQEGLLCDGGGLYLQVTIGKRETVRVRKSWLFRYEIDGRRHDMGLGGLDTRGLHEAREEARRLRQLLLNGDDPLTAKRAMLETKRAERQRLAADMAARKTFAECVTLFLEKHSDGWRNAKHRAQWKKTLETYANPVLGNLFVGDIDTPHIVKLLEPIWNTKRETARRVLGRVERVLNYAKAAGYRTGENPAKWRGHLKDLLPSGGKVVEHHAALPYDDIGSFMAELRGLHSLGACALEFAVLTAVRTGEVLGATWGEIDLKNAVWTIPATRMKSGKEHRVPLCTRSLEILHGLDRHGDRVFHLAERAMFKLLARVRPGTTVHGFRSSFRDWAAETTAFPNHVVEQALAHTIGDKVEAAYRRGDLFNKRRRLMDAWSDYCAKPVQASADVTPLRAKQV
jgi:integrase